MEARYGHKTFSHLVIAVYNYIRLKFMAMLARNIYLGGVMTLQLFKYNIYNS